MRRQSGTTLDSGGAVPDDLLRAALAHPAPAVREHALQVVEPRLAEDPSWLSDVLPRADDRDDRVRFQAAIALGAIRGEGGPGLAGAPARVAVRGSRDRWLRAAILGAGGGREVQFLAALGDRPRGSREPTAELLDELGRLLRAGSPRGGWPGLIRRVVGPGSGFSPEQQAALLTGIAETVRGRNGAVWAGDVLADAIGPGSEARDLADAVRGLVAAMRIAAADLARPPATRRAAVRFLASAVFVKCGETLLCLIDAGQPDDLRAAAVRALATKEDSRVATELLAPGRFARYTPALRDEVVAALFSRPCHLPGLLSALEDGRLPAAAVDALRCRQLTGHRDGGVRRHAEAIFGTVKGAARRSTRPTPTSSG